MAHMYNLMAFVGQQSGVLGSWYLMWLQSRLSHGTSTGGRGVRFQADSSCQQAAGPLRLLVGGLFPLP